MKKTLLVLAVIAGFALVASAQAPPPGMQPPKGHKVAIVVFEDLECPSCRSSEPVLKDAEKSEQVPLVRKDFPIPTHRWSAQAHVIARYFDTVSPALGEDYRHWVFENQTSINKSNLRQMSDNFAAQHKTGLPFAIDPTGALQAKVNADQALGNSMHVTQTPTVFVVGDVKNGQSVVALNNVSELVPAIENMKRQVAAESSARPAKSAKSKSTKKK